MSPTNTTAIIGDIVMRSTVSDFLLGVFAPLHCPNPIPSKILYLDFQHFLETAGLSFRLIDLPCRMRGKLVRLVIKFRPARDNYFHIK